MNKRELGESYEEAASLYLQKKGVRIAERNFRCRQGLEQENKRKYVVWRIIIFTKGDWGKAFRYGLTWLQYVGNA